MSNGTKGSPKPSSKDNKYFMEDLSKRMVELDRAYRESFSHEKPSGDESIQQEYFKVQNQYRKLREKRNKQLNSKQQSNSNNKTFVNSYRRGNN